MTIAVAPQPGAMFISKQLVRASMARKAPAVLVCVALAASLSMGLAAERAVTNISPGYDSTASASIMG